MGNNQLKNTGHSIDNIPILQVDGITDEQAHKATDNIVNAYIFLTEMQGGTYTILKNILKEIHIVTKVGNDKWKYCWDIIGDKAELKVLYNATYSEACHGFSAVINAVLING